MRCNGEEAVERHYFDPASRDEGGGGWARARKLETLCNDFGRRV
jgi:hypothetical protein